MNVVEQIHTFEKENAKLPDKLDDLYPKYLDDEVLKQSKRISKYNVLKVESDKYGKSETYFTFTIYEDYMDFEYLSYNKAKNNFILTDE